MNFKHLYFAKSDDAKIAEYVSTKPQKGFSDLKTISYEDAIKAAEARKAAAKKAESAKESK